jgi:hypothetical protein
MFMVRLGHSGHEAGAKGSMFFRASRAARLPANLPAYTGGLNARLEVVATKIKNWIKDNVEVRYVFEPAPKPGRDGKGGEKPVRVTVGWASRRRMPDDGGKSLALTVAGGIAVALIIALIVSIVDAFRNLA